MYNFDTEFLILRINDHNENQLERLTKYLKLLCNKQSTQNTQPEEQQQEMTPPATPQIKPSLISRSQLKPIFSPSTQNQKIISKQIYCGIEPWPLLSKKEFDALPDSSCVKQNFCGLASPLQGSETNGQTIMPLNDFEPIENVNLVKRQSIDSNMTSVWISGDSSGKYSWGQHSLPSVSSLVK